MPLIPLYEHVTTGTGPLVNVVIVRNLLDIVCTPVEGLTWLKGICIEQSHSCRVLQYQYEPELLLAPGQTSHDGLTRQATALLNDLLLEHLNGTSAELAWIFVCHGFGGLILKRALVLSHLATHSGQSLASVFQRTSTIFFFGTPHHGIARESLGILLEASDHAATVFMLDMLSENQPTGENRPPQLLAQLARQFEQLLPHIHLHNFWEGIPTTHGAKSVQIVVQSSASVHTSAQFCHELPSQHRYLLTGLLRPADEANSETVFEKVRAATLAAIGHLTARSDVEPHANFLRPGSYRLKRGHEFRHNSITGGQTHLGDVYHFNHYNTTEPSRPVSPNPLYLHEKWKVPKASSVKFTGRQLQLQMLHQKLTETSDDQSSRNAPRAVVVCGLGGSGKSQLCIRYAEKNRNDYWGVFWIDASTRATAEADYSALGEEAGRAASFQSGLFWLSESPQPWLLILDNADDPSSMIHELIPQSAHGHVLITTRNRGIIDLLPNVDSLRFEGMLPEEAINLLLAHANVLPRAGDRKVASMLAAELGYLALALKLAGTAIRQSYETIESYLRTYLAYRHDLVVSSQLIQSDETTAIASWDISYDKLAGKGSPIYALAARLMGIFTVMHFASIPVSVFWKAWYALSEVDDRYGFPIVPPDDNHALGKMRLMQCINALHTHSIIEYDEAQETCAIHPVIHRWTRTQLARRKNLEEFIFVTMELLYKALSPYSQASGRSFRRRLLPHIESCMSLLKKMKIALPVTSHGALQLQRFATVYAEMGQWEAALELQRHAATSFKRSQGRWHEQTLSAQRFMAQIKWNRFYVKEAIQVQRDLLFTRWYTRSKISNWKHFWFPQHTQYCIALDDITQSLWLAQEHRISEWTGQRAFDGLRTTLGLDDPLTLNAMLNLGRTYHHLGRLRDAHALLSAVVKKRRRFFGSKHPDTLIARNEMGMIFLTAGQVAVAESIVGNVYAERKRVLGKEHAYTLWSANDLAKVYYSRKTGQGSSPIWIFASKAVALLEGIIPIVVRTLGRGHVGMSMTLGNLARALARCKSWPRAEEVLHEMLGEMNPEHPNWAETMCGLAEAQIELLKLDEAESSCRKVAEMLDRARRSAWRQLLNDWVMTDQEDAIHPQQAKLAHLRAQLRKKRAMAST